MPETAEPAVAPAGRRRFGRFRLRTLLIAMTVCCVWAGIASNRANRQQRAVDAFLQRGAAIGYSYQERPDPDPAVTFGVSYRYDVEPPGPKWLRRIVGNKYFVTPVSLRVSNAAVVTEGAWPLIGDLRHLERLMVSDVRLGNRELASLRRLPRLRLLTFGAVSISPGEGSPDFEFLSRMKQLEVFSIGVPEFGDAQVKWLAECPKLTQVFLYGTSIGDDGLAALAGLNDLEMLGIARTPLTDAGLVHLSKLPRISYVSLVETKVSDAGLKHVAKFSTLTEVELHKTQVTAAGVEELRRALPGCRVTY
jgi:hypothetical protein